MEFAKYKKAKKIYLLLSYIHTYTHSNTTQTNNKQYIIAVLLATNKAKVIYLQILLVAGEEAAPVKLSDNYRW